MRSGKFGFLGSFEYTPAGDPYWSNVQTLLRFNGDLNNEKGGAWSIYLDGVIDTVSPIFGSGSLSNTARGGAVGPIERIDSSASWTIEGFIYCTDRTPVNLIYTSREAGANTTASTLYFGAGSTLTFQIFNAAGGLQQFISSAPLMPLDQVVHIAVSFDHTTNTVRMFQSGVKVLEQAATVSWTKERLTYLAAWANSDQPTRYLRGRMDEWRETIGVCRYYDSFTPPSSPFPAG